MIMYCVVFFVTLTSVFLAPIDTGTSGEVFSYSSNNFHENFGNLLSLLADSPQPEDDFHLPSSPTHLVEFSAVTKRFESTPPPTTTEKTIKAPTSPMSPYQQRLLNASLARISSKQGIVPTTTPKSNTTSTARTTDSKITTTTLKPKKLRSRQRKGLLDLLMPAPRVKSFKGMFDSLRKVLSSTF